MTSSTLILTGIASYMLAMVAIGVYAGRRVINKADYIVAGRRLPMRLVTLTLFATFFGGGTIMGVAGTTYEKGIPGIIADPFGAGVCLLLGAALFFRVLHRMKVLTIVDFFRLRYGKTAELLAGLCMIPPYIGWVASQFVAIGFILSTLTGIDPTLGMIIGAIVVVIYTTVGGLWAVALTDLIQSIVMVIGLSCLSWVVLKAGGGWSAIESRLPAGHLSFFPAGGVKEWTWFIQAWVVMGLGAIPAQDLMQRAVAARTEGKAVAGGYLAGVFYLCFGMIPVFLGLAALTTLPPLDNTETVIPALAIAHLAPLALALVMGAVISGIMSSVDSALLAPASVIGENLAPQLVPSLGDRQVVLISRIAVIVLAAISLVLALHFRQIYDIMVGSWAILLVSLFVPLLFGVYWRRANSAACLSAIVGGLCCWLVFSLTLKDWPGDLFAAVTAALIFVVVTIFSKQTSLPLMTRDGDPLPPGRLLG